MAKHDVDKCLAALAVAYPQYAKTQTNPDLARAVYHRILSDIDGALLEAATMQWLSTARPFHPSPGELRDMALTLITRNEKSADEAWNEVMSAVRSIGYYGNTPNWSSDAIRKTLESFGRWKDFCIIDNDQMPFIRAQFMRIYEAQAKRQHDDMLMLAETRNAVQQRMAQLADSKRLQIDGAK